MIDIAVLQSTKLLDGLSDAQLHALIDASTVATYQERQVVFAERSHSRELYIILAGQVSVVVDLTRLGRRPERPGGHWPRTRSTVRRCSRTPNRTAT